MTRLFAGTAFDRPPRCETCDELETDCRCPEAAESPRVLTPPEQQTARLAVEKRKRGKTVTVIRGLDGDGNDLPALLTKLKTACGAGGTFQDDGIEIQGKQLDRVQAELKKLGYKVRG